MVHKTALSLIIILFSNGVLKAQEVSKNASKVDYATFLKLTEELSAYRVSRMIDIETFNQFCREPNTIILDTRSKKAFDEIHVKGAIHLNFSDFTSTALAKIIPDKTTRILIYCNNNFESSRNTLTNKMLPLALNIPTFINLYGYGYDNIYELKDYLAEEDDRIQFETK